MTVHTTPVYGISYVDTDSTLPDLAAATQAAATTTEAALLRGGVVPPAAADLNAVTARVVTLETAKTADEARITALEQLPRVTVTAATLSPASSTTVPVVVAWSGLGTSRSTAAMWKSATPTLITTTTTGEFDLDVFVPWAGNLTGIRGIAYRIDGGAWTWIDVRINPSVSTLTNAQSGRITGLDLTSGRNIEIGILQSSGGALGANGTRCTLSQRK